MRAALPLVLAAGLVTTVLAFQPPAGQPPAPAPAPQPPASKAIPVPDGPVVKKTELEGGLIAEDLKIGDGFELKEGGAIVFHYHGTLKDGGNVVDSSYERGEPASYPLGGLMPGLQKGIPGMKVGGIRRFSIPAALGYGAQGAGQAVPPNADLVFTIQIVDAMQIEDIKAGEGEAATGNFIAVTAYSMKDKDGKEIEKADASKPYIWVPGEFEGIQFGLEGMKAGGKRKIVVPKEMNVSAPGTGAGRPSDVPLTIEVELIALRNLPQQRRR